MTLPHPSLKKMCLYRATSILSKYQGTVNDTSIYSINLVFYDPRPSQVGMSGACYPDRLINSIPNIYYYAANNPSEATIAKRRSYAATISYLTPPAENAGLYKVGTRRVDMGGAKGKPRTKQRFCFVFCFLGKGGSKGNLPKAPIWMRQDLIRCMPAL